MLTGVSTGAGAIAFTFLLEVMQRIMWGGSAGGLLASVERASPRHICMVLLGAGVMTSLAQLLLRRLSSANGIDTTTAIWFFAGRMPPWRTIATSVLSVIVVAMGAPLGREGAPKQAGAVFANLLATKFRFSSEQRRLLVACGAGAGMSAAYGVPLGGALFSLEVLRGALALRYVLPALATSIVAAAVAWTALPNVPVYRLPEYANTWVDAACALFIGVAAGLVSVSYVRLISWADRNRPSGWQRLVAPVVTLGAIGIAALWFPQILGNGRDVSQQTFTGWQQGTGLLLCLLLLRPAATILCVRSGVPGGLFTPSLSIGALLGSAMGLLWASLIPRASHSGVFALVGAGSVLAATTQGPLSAGILMIELTGRDRSMILPLLLGITTATLVARTIEFRSVYEARLTEEQVRRRRIARDGGSEVQAA